MCVCVCECMCGVTQRWHTFKNYSYFKEILYEKANLNNKTRNIIKNICTRAVWTARSRPTTTADEISSHFPEGLCFMVLACLCVCLVALLYLHNTIIKPGAMSCGIPESAELAARAITLTLSYLSEVGIPPRMLQMQVNHDPLSLLFLSLLFSLFSS